MGKISSIYDLVTELLTSDPKYRDDDNKLVAKIWSHEIHRLGKNYHDMTSYEFLCLYATDWITPADTITRARRKIQECNPLLRGKNYQQRQHIETENVKQEIKGLV